MMDRILACGAAVAAVACGGGGSLELSEFGEAYAVQVCAKVFDCCSSAEQMEVFADAPITDEDSCVTFYRGVIDAFLVTQAQASVTAGRMTYDADRAGACLDTMVSMTCEEFGAGVDISGGSCESPFEGLVADGGSCEWDEDCQSGHCKGGGTFNDEPGTCAQLPGPGESCDFDCVEGHYCEYTGPESTCVPAQADGSECWSDDECASEHCADDTPSDGNPGMCGAPGDGGMCANL